MKIPLSSHKELFLKGFWWGLVGALPLLSEREGSGPYVGGLFEFAACRVCVLGAGGVECEDNS